MKISGLSRARLDVDATGMKAVLLAFTLTFRVGRPARAAAPEIVWSEDSRIPYALDPRRRPKPGADRTGTTCVWFIVLLCKGGPKGKLWKK
jgi:hypothetical protein